MVIKRHETNILDNRRTKKQKYCIVNTRKYPSTFF